MTSYKLKELLLIKNGKDHKELKDGNIPIYGSGGIMRYGDRDIYHTESILLPRKGTLTNIQYVNNPFWTVDTIYYSVINKERANPFYLFNFLKSLDLSNLNSGTGVPSMTFDAYYDIDVYLPDLSTQQKIAAILSALDAKIELNNRINAELEAMAKTLYDYWFVQFDFPDAQGRPYKSSGGKMVWNAALGREVPEGWEIGTLLDIASYVNGLACQKYRPTAGDFLRVIKIREMNEGFTANTELVRSDIPAKAIIENGDVLFSWSASLDLKIWSGGKGALNQHIFKVTSDKYPKSFYYHQLINYLHHFKMLAENRKTTMGHITQEHLQQNRIVIPPQNLIESLDRILEPVISKKTTNEIQSQHLSALRDWLLPMLMNGQVRVEDPEGGPAT
jgi:type I restriction enzyme S subunit